MGAQHMSLLADTSSLAPGKAASQRQAVRIWLLRSERWPGEWGMRMALVREEAPISRGFGDDVVQAAIMLPVGIETVALPDSGKGGEEGVENLCLDPPGRETGCFDLKE